MAKNMILVFLSARPKRFPLHFYVALKANGIASHLISHKFLLKYNFAPSDFIWNRHKISRGKENSIEISIVSSS